MNNLDCFNKSMRCDQGDWKQGILQLQYDYNKADDHLADAVLISSDGRKFHVSKFVMAACGHYFRALYRNILGSSIDATNQELIDVDGEVLGLIIEYAHTAHLRIDDNNIERVLRAVDRLGVIGGIEVCQEFLLQTLSTSNCIAYNRLAKSYHAPKVTEASWNLILMEFRNLPATVLSSMTFDELLEVLKDDQLNVSREEHTYNAIMKWIEADATNRKVYFPELLHQVRFGNSAVKFIDNDILKNEWVHEVPTLIEYLHKVNFVLQDIQAEPVPSKFDIVKHPFLRPRIPRDIIFVFGGWSAASATNAVETYDSRVNKWYLLDSRRVDSATRAYHGMVWLKELIWIIGGFDGRVHFSSVVAFDPKTHKWEAKGHMSQARCYVACTVLDDMIYACGGFDGQSRTNTVERYNPETNQWTQVQPMRMVRSDATAAAIHGRLFICGGFDGNHVQRSVEYYDPAINQWSDLSMMLSPRSGLQSVAMDGYLYVFGGNDGTQRQRSVERYDFTRSRWEMLQPMKTTRSNFAAAALDGLIYIIGGFDGMSTIKECECYDPEKNSWSELWSMNVQRSAVSACVVSDLANAKEFTWLRRELQTNRERRRSRKSG